MCVCVWPRQKASLDEKRESSVGGASRPAFSIKTNIKWKDHTGKRKAFAGANVLDEAVNAEGAEGQRVEDALRGQLQRLAFGSPARVRTAEPPSVESAALACVCVRACVKLGIHISR